MSAPAGNIDLEDLRPSLRLRARLRHIGRMVTSRDDKERTVPRSNPARIGLAVAVGFYIVFVGSLSLRNHWGFGNAGFDLGIFDQGVWLLSRFKDPFVTIMGVDLFGDHTSFILLPLVPLYWIHPTAAILLGAQVVALGAGGVAVFLIARDRLRNEVLALGMCIAYLLNPVIGWTNLENFHPDSFEVPLILFAIYFMLRSRWVPYFAFVIAVMCVKEDVGLVVFGIGVYVALRLDRKVGLATMALAAVWFLANLFVILPAFNEQGTLDAWRIPAEEFGGRGGLIKAIFTRPWDVVAIALRDDKPYYVFQLLAPLAFLPLRGWGIALIATLPLTSNLLSTFFYQYHIEYHYSTMIVPVLVVAAIVGISRFHRDLRPFLVGLAVIAAVITAQIWGPFSGKYAAADPNSVRADQIRRALKVIDDDAAVSSHWSFTAYLAHREQIYDFPVPWHAVNWGNFEQDGQDLGFGDEIDVIAVLPADLSEDGTAILEDLQSEFETVYDQDGILIMSRAGS